MDQDPLSEIKTPYLVELKAAVAQVYAVFGQGYVSAGLEVCSCPVCMSEETRQRIIHTPTPKLSVDLICEYTNSAHGVPRDLGDLRLLLPRYLEIIATDELVDHNAVGADLLLFGDAVAANPAIYSEAQQEAMNSWACALITHFGYADAHEMDNIYTPQSIFEMLLVGGWNSEQLCSAMDGLFEVPDIGPANFRTFLSGVSQNIKTRGGHIGVNWFAMRYATRAAKQVFSNWLNAPAMGDRLADAATNPAVPVRDQKRAAHVLSHAGQFHADGFPQDKHRAGST